MTSTSAGIITELDEIKPATSLAQLRHEAGKIVKAHDQAAGIRRRLGDFDAETSRQVSVFNNEIASLQAIRFDDVDGIQRKFVLGEQSRLYQEQRRKDRVPFAAAVEREAQAATAGCDIPGLLRKGIKLNHENITTALKPFMKDPARIPILFPQIDSNNCLSSLLIYQSASSGIVERLRKFADAKCDLWEI